MSLLPFPVGQEPGSPAAVDFREECYPLGVWKRAAQENRYELCFIEEGAGHWGLSGRTVKVEAGDVLSSPVSGEGIEIQCTKELKIEVLSFPAPLLTGFQAFSWRSAILHRRSRLSAEVAAAMRDCRHEKTFGGPAWEKYVTARAQLLLVHFYRLVVCRPAVVIEKSSDVSRVKIVNYVRELNRNFSRLETMEVVAENLGMSPRHFSALFRNVTGTTWLKYVHSLRIERAKSLLRAKDDSVALIGLQAGFEDATTFHRVFKNTVGISPAEWRSQIRKALPPEREALEAAHA